MTIIEFFDSTPIHNAASTLLLAPDLVVLVGAQMIPMLSFRTKLEKLSLSRGRMLSVEVVQVDPTDFAAITKKLEEILLSHKSCVFDLTGGRTEILVSMGALSERYALPMHTVDPCTGSISPVSFKAAYPKPRKAALSIAENVYLHGGNVTEALPIPQSVDFWEDVLLVWSVAHRDPATWNSAISALHAFCRPEEMFGELHMNAVFKKFAPHKAENLRKTVRALAAVGALVDFREKGDFMSFRYKSEAVQTALVKEGSVLELYVYHAAFIAGNTPFTDAATGVVMDWDAIPSPYPRDDVLNEVDVFLMRGLCPHIVSCKNGFVDSDELYKIAVVADRFGRGCAKKLLVLTSFVPDESFTERAEELGIAILQGVHNLTPEDLGTKIREAFAIE